MKKINILVPFASLLLGACAPSVPLEKMTLSDSYYNNGQLVEFSLAQEFTTLVEAEESFVVYVYLPTCSGCLAFKPYLQSFVTTNDILVYTLNGSIVDHTMLKDVVSYVPSIVLLEKGEVKYHLDPTGQEKKAFESEKAFSSWFFDRVELLEV